MPFKTGGGGIKFSIFSPPIGYMMLRAGAGDDLCWFEC